jgi:hypothetical protein
MFKIKPLQTSADPILEPGTADPSAAGSYCASRRETTQGQLLRDDRFESILRSDEAPTAYKLTPASQLGHRPRTSHGQRAHLGVGMGQNPPLCCRNLRKLDRIPRGKRAVLFQEISLMSQEDGVIAKN